ncbi:MAG: DUF1192 domain-containing protein [Micavibrio sp.]
MFDDDFPAPDKQKAPRNLERLSVSELESYVESLKAEIIRAEAEISRKRAYAAAASSFFKS